MKQKRGALLPEVSIGTLLIGAGLILAVGLIIVFAKRLPGILEFIKDFLGFR